MNFSLRNVPQPHEVEAFEARYIEAHIKSVDAHRRMAAASFVTKNLFYRPLTVIRELEESRARDAVQHSALAQDERVLRGEVPLL